MMNDAFLGSGWEDVRLKIPKGKYRVVMLDLWEHTATVINDFDALKEAMEFVKDAEMMGDDSYTEFVIYNDKGEVVGKDDEKGADIPVPGVGDVDIHVNDGKYVAVALFMNEQGEFEDLIFDTANSIDKAKNLARNLREEEKDASRVIVLDREGKVVWEEK